MAERIAYIPISSPLYGSDVMPLVAMVPVMELVDLVSSIIHAAVIPLSVSVGLYKPSHTALRVPSSKPCATHLSLYLVLILLLSSIQKELHLAVMEVGTSLISVKSVHSKMIILSLMILTVVIDIPFGAIVPCVCLKYKGFDRVADVPFTYDVRCLGPLR